MTTNTKEDASLNIATFSVGNTFFGINILDIQEINKSMNITRIPRSDDFIQGILNLRGKIVTIINLGKKLGLPLAGKNAATKNIIVASEGEHIGFMVDEIREVIQTKASDIGTVPPNMGGIKEKYFKGVLETKNKLIGILDIDEILAVQ